MSSQSWDHSSLNLALMAWMLRYSECARGSGSGTENIRRTLKKKIPTGKKNPFYLNKIIPLSVDTIGAQNRTQLLWDRFTATFTFPQKH